jgi:hypothetical protein
MVKLEGLVEEGIPSAKHWRGLTRDFAKSKYVYSRLLLIVQPFSQDFIHNLVDDRLDLALCMSEQPLAELQEIRDRVSNFNLSFPRS